MTPLSDHYRWVRAQTMALAEGLSEADCQVQSMPDASPVKWHLAHTTWFFETFVLEPHEPAFRPFDPAFRVLFNSYYQGVGQQHPRAQRGLVTRPDLAQVKAYRAQVDTRVAAMLQQIQQQPQQQAQATAVHTLVQLGLQHEQQHQELILTDLLHLLSCNPLQPVYRPRPPQAAGTPLPLRWVAGADGLVDIGHAGDGFAFDNETPRHRHWLRPHALANRLVTCGEWAAFMADGGYAQARWWASAGWDWVRQQQVQAPLYWRRSGGEASDWHSFTLHGLEAVDPCTPVTHVSWYEADAFARWWSAQHPDEPAARLPTEAEWEHAAQAGWAASLAAGHFVESGVLHPLPAVAAAADAAGAAQLLGDVWEWTASAYLPYPGFKPWDGAVGEYNAKFMVNQMVLRGGSCATPRDHIRASYRNFFPADARWQFNGLRLARDEG
jgi:ergothioneine biosynthesis protein EgtB